MFGINSWEFIILAIVAVMVIGPERLPEYTRQLRAWVIKARQFFEQGKQQIKEEVGEDIDWKSLDPRQYDPRRIVREALYEPIVAPEPKPGTPAPFDADAT